MQQVLSFLKETRGEFLKITWPTRQEAVRLSITVIIVSLVIGAFVGGLDFVFTNLVNLLINK